MEEAEGDATVMQERAAKLAEVFRLKPTDALDLIWACEGDLQSAGQAAGMDKGRYKLRIWRELQRSVGSTRALATTAGAATAAAGTSSLEASSPEALQAGEHTPVHQHSLQPPQFTARAACAAPRHGLSEPHPSTSHQQPSWQHPHGTNQLPAGAQSLYGVPLQSQTAEQILVQEIQARQPPASTLGPLPRPSAHAHYNQLPAHMAWQSLSLPSSNAFEDLQGVHRFLGLGQLQ